ncbi:hypothetical protein DFH07DRAFT_733392 [Mycena maculata]|uniref:XRRM domain-containing protein n=1 Tax=Mycena maculata TaxID=230809 RepID=A0AAD7NS28_9AGAR|nr:hypothetical protein DFH07DRAFT_733392 [Mycena maculata]
MSAAFAFVPRKVARAAKLPLKNEASGSAGIQRVIPVDTEGKEREMPPERVETPSKPQHADEDYTTLLCLSLSKYRLWSDPDLRRNIEWSSRARANDDFFPLSYLLESPCPLASAHASETVIVKALRAHATDVVDVRMAIPSSEGPGKTRGNFEIRPKFWDDAVYPVSREGWENRAVYVENIPMKCKTLPNLCRFILALLPSSDIMAAHNRIQGITLPPHHADEPGTEPKLKSFALITFANAEDAEYLVTVWPWARQQNRSEDSPDAADAVKFGFRTLSKARWDDLNTQYLRYRTELLAGMQEQEQEAEVPSTTARPAPPSPLHLEPKRHAPPVDDPAAFVSTMSYPRNCLVFVRNIHPETNKTTLRNLFTKAMDAREALDYVDFNKGMDSCYLRLTTAAHAKSFVDHFGRNKTVHANGLDDSGRPLNEEGAERAVDAELVVGKREEVYWEKVPEKVCLQAVQRALGLEGALPVEENAGSGEGRRRQRKKQKR